jgi:uncharacterized protein (TIGR02284 family)
MHGSSRDALSTVRDLIEACDDSEKGFLHAAQHVKSDEVRSLLQTYARQAGRFAAELQADFRHLGGGRDDHDIFDDGLGHPGWITLKGKLTGEDEVAVMAECECGVGALEKTYAAALETENRLPEDVRSRINRQYAWVKEVCDRIQALAGPHAFRPRVSSKREIWLSDAWKSGDRPPAGPRNDGGRMHPDSGAPA